MKQIPLRYLTDSTLPPVSTTDIIKEVIRQPTDRQKGADIEEIRKGIRVLDALEKTDSSVLTLEDSDWEHLRDKTRAMQWGLIDKRLLKCIDDILDASERLTLNDTVAIDGQVAKV